MGLSILIPRRPSDRHCAIHRLPLLCALVLAVVAPGCLHRHRRAAQSYPPNPVGAPPPAPPGPPARGTEGPAPVVQGEEGLASWYGHPYHGRPTSSGEIYNMYDMTAAHRTLPFGTEVRVHDLENGRSTVVRINDRGPFVEGRIIDLSYAAAKSIGMVARGTALVRLEILNPQVLAAPGVFAVQVGAFHRLDNAQRLRGRLMLYFGPVVIQSFDRGDGMLHRVRVGRASSEDAARGLAAKLRDAGLVTDAYVVRMN